MHERDAIYAKEDFTEADGIKAGELEHEFGEMGGYTAESDAATLLSELGVKDELHQQLARFDFAVETLAVDGDRNAYSRAHISSTRACS